MNTGTLRYSIPDIPVGWDFDDSGGRVDFCVVAISSDGQIVENLSSSYLSFDNAASTLTVAPVFGQKDFCVYVFRNEEAANNFALKSDGNASLTSILAQFEKDNRVLAQLQALQNRNLRSPDECATLPDAKFRKGKLLSFDSNGQPVCSIVAYTKDEILAAAKPYVDAAAASAKSAGDSATLAGDYAAQAGDYAAQATTLAATASASATAAEKAQADAEKAMTDASGSATSAQAAAVEAAKSATACENAQSAAESSATQAGKYATDADNSNLTAARNALTASDYATQAGSAAELASTYAENASDYADNASTSATAAESSAKTAKTQADLAATSAQTAQQAAAQATEISDPEGWRTATRGLITDLAASKGNIGTFHFGSAGGALQTTGNPMFGVLDQSHCMTLELDEDFKFSTHRAMSLNFTGDNQYNSGYYGIGLTLGRNGRFLLRAGNGSRDGGYFGNAPFLNNLFGGTDPNTIPAGKYAFCLCMHFDATDPTASTARIYVNGAKKWDFGYPTTLDENSASVPLQTSTIAWLENSKLGFFDTTNYHKTDSTNFGYGHFEGKANRFAVFNFDMSASDAPYTPGDYASGKRIPVALQSSTAEKRCIVASADYSFGGKVRDISGNENHLTVFGDVKGDKDEAVRQMYNAFSAAYTAENATA